MKFVTRILTAALLLGSFASAAELTLDGNEGAQRLRTMFGEYGHRPRQTVIRDKDGLRFLFPKGGKDVPQTGLYSLFVLTGDCEVACTFDLVKLQPPEKGYGCGVGMAFDAGEAVGVGTLQRVVHPKEGDGYVLQVIAGKGGKLKDEYTFLKTKAKRGWLGLRRAKDELVFLTSEDLAAELKEVGRMSFTDGTIRAVRLFADPGGSPTAMDARLRQVRVRAEEITGGVPVSERKSPWRWWMALPPVVGAGLLVWWRLAKR